jgi:cyclophilin family peptidyl-prolyl cis-trans isomerase
MSLRKTLIASLLATAVAGSALAAEQLGVVFTTDKGDITLELYPEDAPVTVASFVNLAQRGYYDGLKFHRVIANFMIQGGDPTGTGASGPGYKFEDEVPENRKHDRPGILSMANAGPATNGSQFFITHVPTPHLDGKHTVFGAVTKGQDVVNAIAKDDVMKTVRITGDAKKLLKSQADRVAAWNAVLDAKTPEEKTAAQAMDAAAKAPAIAAAEARKQAANEKEDARQRAQALEFVKTQGIDIAGGIETESGLWLVVTKPGEGALATKQNKVVAHASGWLADGTKFWSSHDRDQPMTDHPVTGFVKGFTEGLQHMKAGGEAWLVIPGRLGYGPGGNRGARIPGNATLVFKVELLGLS